MQPNLALNIPQITSGHSRLRIALIDVFAGFQAVDIWARLGWRDTKRRYRRTVFGPFWTTVSLAIFVVTLGLIWANLWGHDAKTYLPYLTSGMVCWALFSDDLHGRLQWFYCPRNADQTIANFLYPSLLRHRLAQRHRVFHNIIILVLVGIYCGTPISWATLLVIPGFLLLCLNLVWIAELLAAICARYRDIQQLVTNLLQISLFLTPIFWTPDQLKGRMAILVEFNPIYHLIAIVREPLLGKTPALEHWVVALVITVLGWATVAQVMRKFRHRIVYWL